MDCETNNDFDLLFQSTPPARGATRRLDLHQIQHAQFQSTPPARGATTPGIDNIIRKEFQSTPPARGATHPALHIRFP